MILVDVNLLVHAVNRDAARHDRARAWWDRQLSGTDPVRVAWATLFGFVRITTNPRIVPKPLSVDEASNCVSSWLSQPCLRTVDPLEGHWDRVVALLREAGTAGNLTTDAHLAALAMEHGCELCSTDSDFARFPGLRWHNPLA